MARPYAEGLERTAWTPKLDARLRRHFTSGLTHTEIAELIGATKSAVSTRLTRLKITRKRQRRWSAEEDRQLAEALDNDLTQRELAAMFCRTIKAIKRRVGTLRSAGKLRPASLRRSRYPIMWKIEPRSHQ